MSVVGLTILLIVRVRVELEFHERSEKEVYLSRNHEVKQIKTRRKELFLKCERKMTPSVGRCQAVLSRRSYGGKKTLAKLTWLKEREVRSKISTLDVEQRL